MDSFTDRKRLSIPFYSLIILIFVLNSVATKFSWYFSVWYFDMIMHFLGGFWIGLAYVYLLSPEDKSISTVFKILLFVIFIGIGWEVYEIWVNEIIIQNPLNFLDIISDILFDLSGGTLAILYFFKKIMPIGESKV
jgi:hypothetical protein